MKKALVFIAQGFEEIEAVTSIDILRRGGVEVELAGIGSLEVKGARNVKLVCDFLSSQVKAIYDLIIIPGGMPGATNIANDEYATGIIKKHNSEGKYIGAICAAPAEVLGKLDLLANRDFTCYPGFQDRVNNGNFVDSEVVVSGNIVTSKAAGTAMGFALKLLEMVVSKDVSDKVKRAVIYS